MICDSLLGRYKIFIHYGPFTGLSRFWGTRIILGRENIQQHQQLISTGINVFTGIIGFVEITNAKRFCIADFHTTVPEALYFRAVYASIRASVKVS